MMGTYRFYTNGELVGEQQNLITDAGRRSILRYLSGYTSGICQSIGVGISDVAASVLDTKLGFEVAKATVDVASPDFVTQRIIFKATLPTELVCSIREAGMFSQPSPLLGTDTRIANFDSETDAWTGTGVTFTSSTFRLGSDGLRLSPASGATVTAVNIESLMDLSDSSRLDEFVIAYNASSAITSVTVKFMVDAANYFSHTFDPATGQGFQRFTMSSAAINGTPSWENIDEINISATATGAAGTFDLDAINLSKTGVSEDDIALVSRAVLGTPIAKTGDSPMEIEYALDVTI